MAQHARPHLLICTQVVDADDPVLGFFHQWIEAFSKQYETVSVICLKRGRLSLPPNVSVYSLGKENGVSRIKYILNFYRYLWQLRKQYDAVFVHMNPEYMVLGGAWWRLMRIPVGLWYVHKSITWRLRIAVFFSSVVFTAVPESFRLASKKVRVVGQGIATDVFRIKDTVTHDELRIITVGRIAESKRVIDMLSVLDVLARENVPFSFTIVGAPAISEDVAYQARLKEEVARRAYASDVHFLGALAPRELPAVLAEADIFLNLGKTGGLDKAVLEAMSCGVVPVTTNGAFRELLSPLGLFVGSDDPEAIAEAIQHARSIDPVLLHSMVEKDHSLIALIPKILSALQ
ncbi:MAG TPA: glycosyltransferase family 4 protein [Candidatus Paceibacterota bacterium]|nr:glycosyltransferase family 4 protein [Candidatus Paceibacterota bacterium]